MSPEIVAILVENHRKFLAFLEKRVGSRAVAEEILQNAYVKVLEQDGELRSDESAVAWFYRLLRNATIDHYRRSGTEKKALAKEAREATELYEDDPAARDVICACMQSLLPTLKPDYAELIEAVDLGEKSITEVATASGMTTNNATVKLHRARRALKERLERSCGTCAEHGCLDCSCGSPKTARA